MKVSKVLRNFDSRSQYIIDILGLGIKDPKVLRIFDSRSQCILGHGIKVSKVFRNFDCRSQKGYTGTWSQSFLISTGHSMKGEAHLPQTVTVGKFKNTLVLGTCFIFAKDLLIILN